MTQIPDGNPRSQGRDTHLLVLARANEPFRYTDDRWLQLLTQTDAVDTGTQTT
jgi:hypothetical protein